MYSKFVITLRKVRFGMKYFPGAPELLEIEYNKLIKKVNKYALKNSEALKQYCILNLNEILKHKREIKDIINKSQLKANELKTTPELEAIYNELEYFKEIGNTCGDAQHILVEYLAVYHHEIFLNPENLEVLRETLPPYDPIRQKIEQKHQKKTEKVKSPFSVPEWATIFYYADETKLLPNNRFKKTRMEQFMNKHKVNTTFETFKKDYHIAIKRINEKNDYPIDKLELIIPFLIENYKQTVTKVKNDIIFLKENKPDY